MTRQKMAAEERAKGEAAVAKLREAKSSIHSCCARSFIYYYVTV